MKRENIVNNINKAFNMIGGEYKLDQSEINDIKENLKLKKVGFQSGGFKEVSSKIFDQARQLFPYKVNYRMRGGAGKKGRGSKKKGKSRGTKVAEGECKGDNAKKRKESDLKTYAKSYKLNKNEIEELKKSMEKTFREDQNCSMIQRRDIQPWLIKTHPEKYMANPFTKKKAEQDKIPKNIQRLINEEFNECSNLANKFKNKTYPSEKNYQEELSKLKETIKKTHPVCNIKIKSSNPTKMEELTKLINKDKKIGEKVKKIIDKEKCKNELSDAKYAKCGTFRKWDSDPMCETPSCGKEQRENFIKQKSKTKTAKIKGKNINNIANKLNFGQKTSANKNICNGPGKCASKGANKNKVLCHSYGKKCKWGPPDSTKQKAPLNIVLPGTDLTDEQKKMKKKISEDRMKIFELRSKCKKDYKQFAQELSEKAKITGKDALLEKPYLTQAKAKKSVIELKCKPNDKVNKAYFQYNLKEIKTFLDKIESNIKGEENRIEMLKQSEIKRLENEKKKKENEEKLAKLKEEKKKKKDEEKRIADEKKREDDRMAKEKKEKEEQERKKIQAEKEKKKAERRAEALKRKEMRKILRDKKIAEEKAKKAEAKRIADEKKIEDKRIADEKKIEDKRIADEKKIEEDKEKMRKKEKAKIEKENKLKAKKEKRESKRQLSRARRRKARKDKNKRYSSIFNKRKKEYSQFSTEKIRKSV